MQWKIVEHRNIQIKLFTISDLLTMIQTRCYFLDCSGKKHANTYNIIHMNPGTNYYYNHLSLRNAQLIYERACLMFIMRVYMYLHADSLRTARVVSRSRDGSLSPADIFKTSRGLVMSAVRFPRYYTILYKHI